MHEHDLLDTRASELADSIDDVVSRPGHRPWGKRLDEALRGLLVVREDQRRQQRTPDLGRTALVSQRMWAPVRVLVLRP
jgi:hypothetical protein